MIRVSILGASGYVGIELIRLLYNHPHIRIAHLLSQSKIGKNLYEIYPHLSSLDLPLLEEYDESNIPADSDIFITALPHGVSQKTVAHLYKNGKTIIDMSGDFRYDDSQTYQNWYGTDHEFPDLLNHSVYGMPELYRDQIKKSKLIGNPGCYTTASILALAPAVKEGIIQTDSIIIDAKSGSSGAGRKPATGLQFCELDENLRAYAVANHRHTSEIEQELSKLQNEKICLNFTPHLLPIKRGILATCYATLCQEITAEKLMKLYQNMYTDEPFIRLYPYGKFPEISHVNGSNDLAIGLCLDERTGRLIVISALDNLIKGAAGQAIQNVNLITGYPENCGLEMIAPYI